MADDKIRLPSGQGGLTRFDESISNVNFSPGTVIVMALFVMLITLVLHYLGGFLLQ